MIRLPADLFLSTDRQGPGYGHASLAQGFRACAALSGEHGRHGCWRSGTGEGTKPAPWVGSPFSWALVFCLLLPGE